MATYIISAYTILFITTITESLPIGWLLTASVIGMIYCILTIFQSNEKLTNPGKIFFAMTMLGCVYSSLTIADINIIQLFTK